jgi:hypothetical protein
MGLGNAGYSFRPRQRGSLAFAEERRLAPGVERVKPLLGFAGRARVFAVHVQAKRRSH